MKLLNLSYLTNNSNPFFTDAIQSPIEIMDRFQDSPKEVVTPVN